MEELSEVLRRLATTRSTTDGGQPPQEVDEAGGPTDSCEVCGGRGWITRDVPVGHREFGRLLPCECQKGRLEEEQHDRLRRYSNLGHLTRFTFGTLKPEGLRQDEQSQGRFRNAYKAALEYADNPKGWLVFVGPNGSGKTHLAAAIANRCIDQNRVVFFSHVPDLLDHLRGSFAPNSEVAYSDLFDDVRNTPVLILDGLGSHSTTPWAEEKLRQIINHRYNAEMPTVVTTAAEVGELDPYIGSRLRSEGISSIIEVQERDPGPVHRLGRILPEMLRSMTFESFDVRGSNLTDSQRQSLEAAYQAARSFASHPDGWLTLFSDATGVGKTHLAIAIAVEQTKKGRPVFYAFVPELLDHLRYTFTPESPVTYDRLFDEVKNTPLLILDDLGREHSSPWAEEKLYQIIVHRHGARLPTVVTSAMDFTQETGPISSRIQDSLVGTLIKIEANDYRRKGRPKSRR